MNAQHSDTIELGQVARLVTRGWRTVVDHKRRLYFFESALTPNTFWVDLKKLDFSAQTGQVRVLPLGENQRNVFAGETSGQCKNARPFEFLGLTPR